MRQEADAYLVIAGNPPSTSLSCSSIFGDIFTAHVGMFLFSHCRSLIWVAPKSILFFVPFYPPSFRILSFYRALCIKLSIPQLSHPCCSQEVTTNRFFNTEGKRSQIRDESNKRPDAPTGMELEPEPVS